jgi:glucose/mannose-6-phosphate isomerase
MREIDKGGLLQACVDFPNFCREAWNLAKDVSVDYTPVEKIIVAGMGGSAIGGDFLKQLVMNNPKTTLFVEVCRDYRLPAYADEETLVFIISYSGETEETLNAFVDALKKKCKVICISSGGTLTRFTEKFGLPLLRVPSGLAPRAAFPYLFLPMFSTLQRIGVLPNMESEIKEAVETLEKLRLEISPKISFEKNFAKKLAWEILGAIPVVYGFRFYGAVARRFKTQFNENSKLPCKCEVFPELNHNEIVGWEAHRNLTKVFSVVFLRDEAEPAEIKSRIEATKELIVNKVNKIIEVWGRGKSILSKMLSATYIGDLASVYLALLQGVDPMPVKTITLLKQRMETAGFRERAKRELRRISG